MFNRQRCNPTDHDNLASSSQRFIGLNVSPPPSRFRVFQIMESNSVENMPAMCNCSAEESYVSTFLSNNTFSKLLNWKNSNLIIFKPGTNMQITHVIDSLEAINIDLKQIKQIGNYKQGNILLVQFLSELPANNLEKIHTIEVNGNIGHVVRPSDNLVNIYINYLPYQTPDRDIESVLNVYGKVLAIKNVYLKDKRLGTGVLSDKRLVVFQLNQGVLATSIPG